MSFGYVLYFVERAKNRVVRWNPDTGKTDVVAGGPGLRNSDQELSAPYALATEPDGSLLIADKHHDRVCRVVNGRLNSLTHQDPTGGRKRKPGNSEPFHETKPSCPTGLFMEPSGSFLCTYSKENTIYRVHPNGTLEHILGIPPNRHHAFWEYKTEVSSREALNTHLLLPTSIVEKKDGSIYFIERMVNTVRKYSPKSGLTCLFPWERREEYFSKTSLPDSIPLGEYHPAYPNSLTLDSQDVLYVSEGQHACILKIDEKQDRVFKVVDCSQPVEVRKPGPAHVGFGPDGTAWVLNLHRQAIEAYEPTASGPWKPLPTKLTTVEGQALALAPSGSALAFGAI